MSLATKEVRRRPSNLQSMRQLMPEVRIQATNVVGERRAATSTEGTSQEQNQANEDVGAARLEPR